VGGNAPRERNRDGSRVTRGTDCVVHSDRGRHAPSEVVDGIFAALVVLGDTRRSTVVRMDIRTRMAHAKTAENWECCVIRGDYV